MIPSTVKYVPGKKLETSCTSNDAWGKTIMIQNYSSLDVENATKTTTWDINDHQNNSKPGSNRS